MLVAAITIEMFMPVLIIAGILLTVTILLAIADKLLVSYGECKITVEKDGEQRDFCVQGGGTLLTALIDNGMSIPASCAGRGSCGYCKVNVRSGGGQMLPTEEIFISKDEERTGTRLACQVKVKEDIELYVPDLLITVRNMVKKGTFDTRMKWRFKRLDQAAALPEERGVGQIDKAARMKVEGILERYVSMEGALMPVLQAVNEAFNHLPEPVLREVAVGMDIPLATVFRVATFYNAFSLEPRGKHIITVCTGTACHVKGASDILATFEEHLGIKAGDTTEDMLFTLDGVRCIGCCGLAPVLTIGEDVHGLMTKKKVPELLEMYRAM